MTLVLSGLVAPMRPGGEGSTFTGAVWLGEDGSIEAVTRKGERAPPGFDDARHVAVGDAVIHPGFIDLHSHLGYNSLPLWADPTQATPYLHHDIWPGEHTYGSAVAWPSWTLLDRAPECVLAYVQVRALAGGTTSIQGWPNVSRPPTNALVRSVEDDAMGPISDPVMVSALTEDVAKLSRRASGLRAGRAFVYHCAEGRPGSIVAREFDDLATAGCLQRGLAAIHCTALDRSHFARWRKASRSGRKPPGTVVWSPFSNLWLYGVTTDVPAAMDQRLAVCLGTDWGPSGTKNLLGEMKVARLWSEHQGWDLTDLDLARMVTSNPGDFLAPAWGRAAGRLVPGGLGDAVVLARRRTDVWANLVGARESDVLLVVTRGRARYGTAGLMRAAGESDGSVVPVGRASRRVTLVRPDDPSRSWAWADLRARLRAVRADASVHPPGGPAGSRATRDRPRSVLGGDPPGTPPIVARPDMPGAPAQAAGPPPRGVTVDVPPLEPFYANESWLASIRGRGFHGGILDALAGLYR